MRRVQNSTPITDFGGRKQISFDALFSSDSEEEATTPTPAHGGQRTAVAAVHKGQRVETKAADGPPTSFAFHGQAGKGQRVISAPPSPDFPYRREEDPISVWTQKVTESFEKASKKQLPPDFKESLGRLSFFRKPMAAADGQMAKELHETGSVSKEQSSPAAVNAQ